MAEKAAISRCSAPKVRFAYRTRTTSAARLVCCAQASEFTEIPIVRPYTENSRGLGLADMAHALRTGRRHRANCDQTCHVLEIMTSFEKSSRENRTIQLETTFERGAPMKYTKLLGILDD